MYYCYYGWRGYSRSSLDKHRAKRRHYKSGEGETHSPKHGCKRKASSPPPAGPSKNSSLRCPFCGICVSGGELTLSAHMKEVHAQLFGEKLQRRNSHISVCCVREHFRIKRLLRRTNIWYMWKKISHLYASNAVVFLWATNA